MSDRLKELQRQRALAQEQVDFFDREIARESGASPVPTAPATPPPAAVPAAPEKTGSGEVDTAAEKILERYRHTEHPVRDQVRRGCLLYFFVALGLLVLGLVTFYLVKKHGATATR